MISNLTISNGRDYNSGAILNDGATLTVNNCVFTANSGGGYGGGGIVNDGSNANARLTVNNCVFDGNSAEFIADLPPGNYTAIVRGVNNTTGVALAEVYDLDR